MESLQGQLLIAAPELRDPNFSQTVVLLVRHNDEGALGLVLNRPLKVRLQEVWKQVGEAVCARDDVIYLGGPCEGPLMALHDRVELSEADVPAGLCFSTDRAALSQLADDTKSQVRFFAGFAGWGAGQLESELAEDSWLTTPATPAHVFDVFPDLWDKTFREVKGREILGTLGIRGMPKDLRSN
ncbi:MAG: YqgE/AlgH family protein [Planctomycetales bacterium]|nr:YqgE/AlgH family protein [Planctomycetales bacterium]MBN8628254.1 YqgE/AlgH family protein [Planctomycetota bacterium]